MYTSQARTPKDPTIDDASLSLGNLGPGDISALNEEIEGLNKVKMEEFLGIKARGLVPIFRKLMAEADQRRLDDWGRKSKLQTSKDGRHDHLQNTKTEMKFDSTDPDFVTFLNRFEDYIGNVQQLAANKHLDTAEQQRLLRILAAMHGPISQTLAKKNWIFVPNPQVREFLGIFFNLLSQIRELLSQIVKVKMGICCNSVMDDLKKQLKMRVPELESRLWAFPILFGLEGRHVTIINNPEPDRSVKDLPPLAIDEKTAALAFASHLMGDIPDLQPMYRLKIQKETEFVSVPAERVVHKEAPMMAPGMTHSMKTDKLSTAHEHMYGLGRKKDVAAAFRLYQTAETEGSAVAATCLGKLYAEGQGTQKNLDKAKFYLDKAANLGDAEASYQLGQLYQTGQISNVSKPESMKLAVQHYERAAQDGHPDALTDLGFIFEKGLAGPVDQERAIDCYKKAVLSNNARAMNNLGVFYLSKSPSEAASQARALDLFKQGAALGSPLAQTNLGICYVKGLGTKQDYLAAQQLFEEAAEKNDADALFFSTYFRLKEMQIHSSEDGYHQSAEALRRVLIANPAHSDAMYYLGYLYENGFGVAKDAKTALHFYTRAIETSGNKDGKSMYKTANLLYNGAVFGFQNKPKAVSLYQKAAELGDCDAAYVLGVLHEEGTDVEYNRALAERYYNLSAKHGNTDAQFNLALMQMAKLQEARPGVFQTVREGGMGRTLDQKSVASEETGLDDLTPEQLIVDAANKGNKRAFNYLQGRNLFSEVKPSRNNYGGGRFGETHPSGLETVNPYRSEEKPSLERPNTNFSNYTGLLQQFMIK
jgi:hypothetical protein